MCSCGLYNRNNENFRSDISEEKRHINTYLLHQRQDRLCQSISIFTISVMMMMIKPKMMMTMKKMMMICRRTLRVPSPPGAPHTLIAPLNLWHRPLCHPHHHQHHHHCTIWIHHHGHNICQWPICSRKPLSKSLTSISVGFSWRWVQAATHVSLLISTTAIVSCGTNVWRTAWCKGEVLLWVIWGVTVASCLAKAHLLCASSYALLMHSDA